MKFRLPAALLIALVPQPHFHFPCPDLPQDVRSLVVGFRATLPRVEREGASPAKRADRKLPPAAAAEPSPLKRPASPTPQDEPPAKSPKNADADATAGAAAEAPQDDTGVPAAFDGGWAPEDMDFGGGGDYGDVFQGYDNDAAAALPRTDDVAKADDAERQDEDADLEQLEGGHVPKRAKETATVLARHLEGRQKTVVVQSIIKEKVRILMLHQTYRTAAEALIKHWRWRCPCVNSASRRGRRRPPSSMTCWCSRRAATST